MCDIGLSKHYNGYMYYIYLSDRNIIIYDSLHHFNTVQPEFAVFDEYMEKWVLF
jgi:hypothetical protein